MKLRDLLLGSDGLLKPEIQAAKFDRIHYGPLSRAIGIGGELGYSPELDRKIEAFLAYGILISSHTFLFRGAVVYSFEGELVAFSWKNCGNCPTRVAFFPDSDISKLRAELLMAAFPMQGPIQPIDLDSPFEPRL